MLELFRTKWASVDHVLPVSKGGLNEIGNYVTACWECNLTLGDTEVGDKPAHDKTNADNEETGWDGMSSLYPKLAGKNDEWVKLLEGM